MVGDQNLIYCIFVRLVLYSLNLTTSLALIQERYLASNIKYPINFSLKGRGNSSEVILKHKDRIQSQNS